MLQHRQFLLSRRAVHTTQHFDINFFKRTAAPSDLSLSAVGYPPGPFSLPVLVNGSRSGGGGGFRGQQVVTTLQELSPDYSTRLPRACCTSRRSHGGDRSWGAPFSWGVFGEGAPTVVGVQNYLGPYHGEYYYPSDPYRSHPFEQQPSPFQDFGTDFDPVVSVFCKF